MISTFRFILASLYHYRRSNVATALGVIVATAVFTGAFLVGHSMRASLRHLALDAIGSIDEAVFTPRFMPGLSEDENGTLTEGIIQLEGTLQSDDREGTTLHRTRSVKIYGVSARFWDFFENQDDLKEVVVDAKKKPMSVEKREVVLNRATADTLQVKVGDWITIRVPRQEAISAESIFGHKDRGTESFRVKVSHIIPDRGPGRFTLNPSQHTPKIAYLPLSTLQWYLDTPDQVNTLLVGGGQPSPFEVRTRIKTLGQLGLHAETTKDDTFLSTDRMFFLPGNETYIIDTLRGYSSGVMPTTARSLGMNARSQSMSNDLAVVDMAPLAEETTAQGKPLRLTDENASPVLTYMANTICVKGRKKEVPYSTVTAYDFSSGIFSKETGPLRDDPIVINAWTAKQLDAKVGDTITLRYFRPDSAHDGHVEESHDFRLVAILPMSGEAVDRRWTPRASGITDEESVVDWEAPFPFDRERIRRVDEDYWSKYKATPKAFVPYGIGKRLWGSRLGNATSIRITPPLEPAELDTLAERLDPARFGLTVRDVRRHAIEASVGTTSFAGLFLALSFFVIAAALILVALMFRLGVDARVRSIGLLAAVGFSRRQIAWILIGEGLCVATVGSLIGVLLGVLYARLLILGLSTWWIGAIGTPFLSLYVTTGTLLLGFVSGTLTSAIVIVASLRRLLRISPNQLLAGQTERVARFDRIDKQRRTAWIVTLNLWAAVGAVFVAYFTIGIDARYETVIFFGSGILTLLATLATVRLMLLLGAERPMLLPRHGNRLRFASRAAARHPMRSMAIVGMMASTVFLVVSIGAFRLEPITNALDPNGPTGGFQLVGQADMPIYSNLATPDSRADLGFTDEDETLLGTCRIVAMRVSSGDNASCLNLFRPGRPQFLGVPDSLTDPTESGAISTTARSLGMKDETDPHRRDMSNDLAVVDMAPRVEQSKHPAQRPVPVALEKNVANYSFQLWGGIGETFDVAIDSDTPLTLEVRALLGPSPFLGNLLLAERDFQRLFPDIDGHRFFLIRTPAGKEEAVRTALERTLGDYGFAAERTVDRLASVSVVQNTYLATFQSLGALGLLLGLAGLLAVEMRNVMERRSELALLGAIGFPHRMLVSLLTLENMLLLMAGLVSGLVAAIVSIVPHLTDATATASVPISLLASILGLVLLLGIFGLPATATLALRHLRAKDLRQDR